LLVEVTHWQKDSQPELVERRERVETDIDHKSTYLQRILSGVTN
jgi:hypothetical protein